MALSLDRWEQSPTANGRMTVLMIDALPLPVGASSRLRKDCEDSVRWVLEGLVRLSIAILEHNGRMTVND